MPRKIVMSLFALVLAASSLAGISKVLAVNPDEMLQDPKQEQRAREISTHLRCLVCQNETIDDSNAPLAKDLRLLVRERITKGDDNNQVIQYVVDRYGEFVLLRPRFSAVNLILWTAPFLLLGFAGFYFFSTWRSRSDDLAASVARGSGEGLSEAEQAKLAELMKDE